MPVYNAIGLMSGTSLDGLDIAYCHFEETDGRWSFLIKSSKTIPYGQSWKIRLNNAPRLTAEELALLDRDYGRYLGRQVREFCRANQLHPKLVASHGHTVFHQPGRGMTYQVGHGPSVAASSGFPVVFDFRSLDVALGGQGAPLVPVGDHYLFSEYDFCLNLGGFSNISFLKDSRRMAFDICPVNIALNYVAKSLGLEYDRDGDEARKGAMDVKLLDRLNEISFYEKPGPKSLGREWFVEEFLPVLESSPVPLQNKLRTLVEHIALMVSRVVEGNSADGESSLLLTGGGARNRFLVERITDLTPSRIVIPEGHIIDYKEALIFAFLGVLRWRGEINTFASVTGARKDSCGGGVSFP